METRAKPRNKNTSPASPKKKKIIAQLRKLNSLSRLQFPFCIEKILSYHVTVTFDFTSIKSLPHIEYRLCMYTHIDYADSSVGLACTKMQTCKYGE